MIFDGLCGSCMHDYVCTYMQKIIKNTESSLDQKVVQRSSEILMLEKKYDALKKKHEQLIGLYSKYKRQENRISIATQTDQVIMSTHVRLKCYTKVYLSSSEITS